MTAIDVLTEDHATIERLFDEYTLAHTSASALRIGDAIVLHLAMEEMFLYPLVRTALADGARLVGEAASDHERVKAFVAEVEGTWGCALDELVGELRNDVAGHHRWEHEDLFPRVSEMLDAATLRDVGDRMVAFRRRQPVS